MVRFNPLRTVLLAKVMEFQNWKRSCRPSILNPEYSFRVRTVLSWLAQNELPRYVLITLRFCVNRFREKIGEPGRARGRGREKPGKVKHLQSGLSARGKLPS